MSDAQNQFRHLERKTQLHVYYLAFRGRSHPDTAIRDISLAWALVVVKTQKIRFTIMVLITTIVAPLLTIHAWSTYSRGGIAGFLLIGWIAVVQQSYIAKKIIATEGTDIETKQTLVP